MGIGKGDEVRRSVMDFHFENKVFRTLDTCPDGRTESQFCVVAGVPLALPVLQWLTSSLEISKKSEAAFAPGSGNVSHLVEEH
jgi:hypothetical protein